MTPDESQGMAVAAPPFKRARKQYSQADDSTADSSNGAAPSEPASSANDGSVPSVSEDLDALSIEMKNALVGDPDAVPAQPPTQSPPKPQPEMTEVIAAPESGMPDAPTPGLIDPGSGSAGSGSNSSVNASNTHQKAPTGSVAKMFQAKAPNPPKVKSKAKAKA
jgi:hypothetical protein